MTNNRGFSGVPVPERPKKPRDVGVTMMIDWGLPLGLQQDLLDLTSSFTDLAKVAVGLSGLYDIDKLRAKVELYQQHDVEPFPGGMFLEYAVAHEVEEQYWKGCEEAGYRLIEVSDNAIPLDRATKTKLIRTAIGHGFRVLGEVGSKHVISTAEALIDDVSACLDAGAWKVLIEAAELFEDGQLRTDLVDRIRESLEMSRLLWELPGIWIKDIHEHQIHELAVWLLENLGSDSNIANVAPFAVAELETLRTGVGVRTLVGNPAIVH